ncbi:MAG: zinc-binding dehydrogenase, partial [Chloroflexota bacterium]
LVTRARLEAGETALIWGASSGLGSAAIQIAKRIGARVIATAGGAAKVERARALGADRIVDYQSENVTEVVRTFTAGHGAAVVFDHVGVNATATSLDCLARGGRLVIGGATTGSDVGLNLMRLVANNLQIHACLIGTPVEFAAVLRLAEQGAFQPVIDRIFRLDQAPDAHCRIESPEHFGKIVLSLR